MKVTFRMRSQQNQFDIIFTRAWDNALDMDGDVSTNLIQDIWDKLKSNSTITPLSAGYYEVEFRSKSDYNWFLLRWS